MGGQWAQPLVRSVDLNCDGEPGDGYAGVWWGGARGVCVCVCVCVCVWRGRGHSWSDPLSSSETSTMIRSPT